MESSWSCFGSLEASWKSLGAPLGPKRSFERLLGAPRGISRQVSAILGPENLPQRSPGGSEMEPQRRLELKKAKSQTNARHVRRKPYFEAPGPPQNRSRTDPKLAPNRIFQAEALEKPLESLSERSWALFERSWTALEALLDTLGAESTPVKRLESLR